MLVASSYSKMNNKSYGYGKRPLWQWILLYVVIGGLIYGAVYYFFLAGKGSYSYPGSQTQDSNYR